ncbi:MAG: GNAT family N-acetyltransferase [Patescibacteria group bacterium]|jgi:hypothetical protein
MEIKFGESAELWDEFVHSSPQRSVFVSTKFLNSLNTKYELVTCAEDNKIVAGLVVLFGDDGPISGVFPFTEYQGLSLADNSALEPHRRQSLEFKVTEFLIAECTEHYGQLCLCHSWRLVDMRPFQWFNYHEPEKGVYNLVLRYSAVLDLRKHESFDEYLGTIRKVRRQEIKKAFENLKIEEIDDEMVLDDLHDKTFKRQGIERDEKESLLLRSITKSALDNHYGRLTCVKVDGVPVAANLFIFDDRSGFYLFGANHPDYRNLNAGTLLLADAVRDAMDKKLSEVDFVGANSPNRGDFKLSFNPELKPYFVTTFKPSV